MKRRPEIILMLLFALVLLLLIAAIFQLKSDAKEHSEAETQMAEETVVTNSAGDLPSRDRSADANVSWLAKLFNPSGLDEQEACLAEALYFEARSESVQGQIAVAEVILNRVQDTRFPDNVCDVVYQGSQRRNACQFSYACDGTPEVFNEPVSHDRAKRLAIYLMEKERTALTRGALFYHTLSVQPRWSVKLIELVTIGDHKFLGYPKRD